MSHLTPRHSNADTSTDGRCCHCPTPSMGEVMRPHQLDMDPKRRSVGDRIVGVFEIVALGIAAGVIVIAGFVPRAGREAR